MSPFSTFFRGWGVRGWGFVAGGAWLGVRGWVTLGSAWVLWLGVRGWGLVAWCVWLGACGSWLRVCGRGRQTGGKKKSACGALFCSRLRRAKGLVDGRDGDKKAADPPRGEHTSGEKRACGGLRQVWAAAQAGRKREIPRTVASRQFALAAGFFVLRLRRGTGVGSGTAGENKTRNSRLRWYKKSETWGTPHHTTPHHSTPIHSTPHHTVLPHPLPAAGWAASQWLAGQPANLWRAG